MVVLLFFQEGGREVSLRELPDVSVLVVLVVVLVVWWVWGRFWSGGTP